MQCNISDCVQERLAVMLWRITCRTKSTCAGIGWVVGSSTPVFWQNL